MRVYAILERYRRIRRSYDVIIFDVTSHPTFFRKHTSAEPIRIKIGTIVHFDEKNDVIKFWRHVNTWWRHNSVKNVGIDLNFFLWILIVKKNNRANFYENRFSRSMISEKRRIWRHVKNWWRHNSVKNVGIDLKFYC